MSQNYRFYQQNLGRKANSKLVNSLLCKSGFIRHTFLLKLVLIVGVELMQNQELYTTLHHHTAPHSLLPSSGPEMERGANTNVSNGLHHWNHGEANCNSNKECNSTTDSWFSRLVNNRLRSLEEGRLISTCSTCLVWFIIQHYRFIISTAVSGKTSRLCSQSHQSSLSLVARACAVLYWQRFR